MSSRYTTRSSKNTTAADVLPPYKRQSTLLTQDGNMGTEFPAKKPKVEQPMTMSHNHNIPSLPCEVVLEAISFSDTRTNNETGKKSVYVNYKNRRFPMVQTPWVTSWGIESSAKFSDNTSSVPKLSMNLTLDKSGSQDAYNAQQVDDLTVLLEDMDTRLTELAVKRPMELFKKRQLDQVTVREAMLNPFVRTSESGVKRFKVHFSNYSCPEIYNEQKKLVPKEDWESVVTGKMRVRAILECKPVWFMSAKFGCKWEVKQLEFQPMNTRRSFDTFMFDTGSIPTDLDVPSITFTDVKINPKTNSKQVYLNAPGGGPLCIQTRWLTSYDGLCPPPAEFTTEGDAPKYSIRWPVKANDPDEKTTRELFQSLDQHILKYAQENSQVLFKKKMSIEVIQALYTPLVKEEYPALKAKAPFYDDRWLFAAYNKEGERLETGLDVLLGGKMKCRAILQCSGLWFLGGRFGCNWHIKQLEYEKEVSYGLERYAFRRESSECADTVSSIGEHVSVSTPSNVEDEQGETTAVVFPADEDNDDIVVESDGDVVDSDIE